MEPIAMVMRRLEWFGQVKIKIRTFAEMKMGEAPYRKTEVEMEGRCQKGHESLEDQGGMGH